MFDRIKVGVSNFAASKAFCLDALEPLDVALVAEGTPTYRTIDGADGKPMKLSFR